MLMIPVRSAALLLDSIDQDKRDRVTCHFRMPQMEHESQIKRTAMLEFKEVRMLQNVAVFLVNEQFSPNQKGADLLRRRESGGIL